MMVKNSEVGMNSVHQSSRDAAAKIIFERLIRSNGGRSADWIRDASNAVSQGLHDDDAYVQAIEVHRATVTAELVERLCTSDAKAIEDVLAPFLPRSLMNRDAAAQAIAAHIREVASDDRPD